MPRLVRAMVNVIRLPNVECDEGRARLTSRGPILGIGVTAKEEAFCRAVVIDGLNWSDAYRSSHAPRTMSAATLWRKASAIASKDRVRTRMEALRAEIERQAYDDAGQVRRLVIERLHYEALHAPNDGARIRALELLGKLDFVGMFRERRAVEVADQRSADEIAAELTARLKSWLPEGRTFP